jgi:peptidyl-prolyl cis-trans isomerase B (cyclophilin B)
MSNLLHLVLVPVLGFATLLPAQEGEKSKPAAEPKAESQAPKDDPTTAKDPAIQAIDKFIAEKKVDKSASSWKQKLTQPPVAKFDDKSDYFWHIETNLGPVKIRYFADTAPIHVTSGIYLARLGFYDGLSFHRVIPAFMAQGGDPMGTGSGGPGYYFAGEFQGGRKHDRPGLLSMANRAGDPASDGSQFFLTFVPTPHLDGKHTLWGEVVDGMATLKALENQGTSPQGRTKSPLSITRSWVTVAPKKGAEPAKEPAKEGK